MARDPVKRPRREVENSEFINGFGRRILTAMGKRVSDGDLDALPALAAHIEESQAELDRAVQTLRSEPWCFSWQQIGDAMGISRKTAQKRWGHLEPTGGRKAGGQPSYRR